MRRTQQKPGPNPKKPEKIDHGAWFRMLNRDALAILRDCHAPQSWGENEASLLFWALQCPKIIQTGTVGGPFVYTDESGGLSREAWRAMWFANLFAEAPKTVMDALPKLKQLAEKNWKSSRFVAVFTLLNDGWHWENEKPAETLERLFNTGNKLKERLGMTDSTIRHAREDIRTMSKGPDFAPPWWENLPAKPLTRSSPETR